MFACNMMYIMCVKKHIIQTVLFCILVFIALFCRLCHIFHMGNKWFLGSWLTLFFCGSWGLHLGNWILLKFHNASPVLSGDCIETIANTLNYNWSSRGQKDCVQQHMRSQPSVVKSCIQFPKSFLLLVFDTHTLPSL